MTVPRSPDQLARAAAEAEAWLDSLDPDTTPAQDPTDLRHIGEALRRRAAADADLAQAVAEARAAGRSWGVIGLVLGVSRQAARERFGSHEAAVRRTAGATTRRPTKAVATPAQKATTRSSAATATQSPKVSKPKPKPQPRSTGRTAR